MDLLTEFYEIKKKIESVAREFHNDHLLNSARNCEKLLKESLSKGERQEEQQVSFKKEKKEILADIDLYEVIEQIRDGIILFGSDGKIMIWNSGAEAITGIRSEDALGRLLPDIQYELLWGEEKDRDFIDQRFREVVQLSKPEIFNKLVINVIHVPGKGIRNIQAVIFPVYLDKGRWVFGSVLRDISDIKAIENQLRELNAMKDKVFSIIAHDLRSPFNNIISVSHLLLEHIDIYDRDTIKKFIEQIQLTAEPTLNILDNLLNLAVSLDPQMGRDHQEINLKAIMNEVIDNQSYSAAIKDITLSHNITDDLTVKADDYLLRALLRNLISNAVKFTHAGGRIMIKAKKINGFVEVTISDTGIGMEKEKLEKLFRIESSDAGYGTEGEKGSGIGLILCREIVQKFGGRIWVESEPGKGSDFIFTLPV